MIQIAQNVIQSLAAERSDFRLQLFDVALPTDGQPSDPGGCLAVRGKVLEQDDFVVLMDELTRALPGQRIDTSGLHVLRKAGNPILMVGTNLTSLHREPSFLAEQLSQLVNGMLVEILFEEGRWAFVRQSDGYLGWTYRPYLTAESALPATHILISAVEPLLAEARANSAVLTRVPGSTMLHATGHIADWSEVELAGGLRGWLKENSLRPLADLPYPADRCRTQMILDTAGMIGVPYLWGGNTANGIDCSGLVQWAHRCVGLTIPRDGDLQYSAGKPIEPPFHPGDLVFFGEKGEKRSITHVAISLGGWQIIHSSRSRNGVYIDNVQAVPHLRESYLTAATYLED